ncbi:hypothetical protein CALCODRAFT_487172 [Calocera cornea HHB12733]|uniref:Uncharacterized protein n=1 Tax=Calocera cornea HHB12733 TaxID=1353952 RepID=A0A165DA02_9BASI|nr:hypothetical protein CALCODRAFT_487172 [Calocera cornea HHB12733]
MRTALRTSQNLRAFRPPSAIRRTISHSRTTAAARRYSSQPGDKGYDKGPMQEAPSEGDTAADEDAQVDTGPTSAGDNTTAQNKDPAGKGEKGPLGPTGGDSPSSTA